MTEASTDAASAGDTAAAGLPTLSVAGSRATIRLNRPRVHNRIEPPDLEALVGLFDQIEANPELRVAIMTATGRSFSSGFHIGELGPASRPSEHSFERVADRLERLRLPTICALQGGVYGGSTDLALACDFRIGVPGISMFMPAAKLGLHYYPSGLQRYVSRLGADATKRLFLTGEKIGAERMLEIGFLTELVAAGQLMTRVNELAGALAGNAPLAVQGMKAAINDIARGTADLDAIEAAARASRTTRDMAEGRAAWLEKRPPRFIGA